MLLDYMRRNTKRFLIATIAFIVPAFVLWGSAPTLGKKGRTTVINAGGEKISLESFTAYYQNLREVTRSNLGANYTPELEKMLNLKQQALDRMVREILLGQEVDRLNIVVSDEEVQDSLKRIPAFSSDGKFDPAKWNAALGNPRINWAALAEQERESLRIEKLMGLIESEARATEEEIREEYRRQHEKASFEFITLKASDLADEVEISSDDLSSYYERHKQEYAKPAQVKLAYVELKKEPSQMDMDAVKGYAEHILERARAGDDFAEMAEKYSEDTATKANGGDLGFFRKGRRMAKEFDEVAFSLAPGEISDLVKTRFGYHIIKVEETKGDGDSREVRARHILLKVEPSEDTLLSLEEQAMVLAGATRDSSLEAVASTMEMEASSTSLFDETGKVVSGIGYAPEISEILPGLEVGKASDMIETKKALYVVAVTERIPEEIPALEVVEERVRAAAEKEKTLELAKAKAEQIIREINENGATLGDIAGAPEPQEVEPFTRRDHPRELRFLRERMEKIFELSEGEAAGPFTDQDSAYVILPKEKIAPDPDEYDSEKDSIKDQLLMDRKRQVVEDYYERLREKAGVKIKEGFLQTA